MSSKISVALEMEGALKEAEAAALLDVTVHTLRWWRHVGRGPAYLKGGKKVLYPRKRLEEFKESRLVLVIPNGKRRQAA